MMCFSVFVVGQEFAHKYKYLVSEKIAKSYCDELECYNFNSASFNQLAIKSAEYGYKTAIKVERYNDDGYYEIINIDDLISGKEKLQRNDFVTITLSSSQTVIIISKNINK